MLFPEIVQLLIRGMGTDSKISVRELARKLGYTRCS